MEGGLVLVDIRRCSEKLEWFQAFMHRLVALAFPLGTNAVDVALRGCNGRLWVDYVAVLNGTRRMDLVTFLDS